MHMLMMIFRPIFKYTHIPKSFKYLAVRGCATSQYQDFQRQENGLLYEGHRPTSLFQKGLLAIGSAVSALNNPYRSDMVAVLGETTGYETLRRLQLKMLNNRVGCQILREKPIIDRTIVNVKELLTLPRNTFGYAYASFMESNGLSSDARDLVHFVDNTELAYIMKRYRQIHDFVHVLLGYAVTVPDEVVVKWFEFAHFGFPMTTLSAFFGPLAASFEEQREIKRLIPWAVYNGFHAKLLLNVYFEHEFEKDFGNFKNELGITNPP